MFCTMVHNTYLHMLMLMLHIRVYHDDVEAFCDLQNKFYVQYLKEFMFILYVLPCVQKRCYEATSATVALRLAICPHNQ